MTVADARSMLKKFNSAFPNIKLMSDIATFEAWQQQDAPEFDHINIRLALLVEADRLEQHAKKQSMAIDPEA